MARTPQELRERIAPDELALADQLEAKIDRSMDQYCGGGRFEYPVDRYLPDPVIRELKKRYRGWIVEFGADSTYMGEPQWVLTFEPLLSPR